MRLLQRSGKLYFHGIFVLAVLISNFSRAEQNAMTPQQEFEAQKKLVRLQSAVDQQDFVLARCRLESFIKQYKETSFYEMNSKKIKELQKIIARESKKIEYEDKIEYIFIPPRLNSILWKEYMAQAKQKISESRQDVGVTILRVIFEDSENDFPAASVGHGNDLCIFMNGGYGMQDSFQSGEPLFIGSHFRDDAAGNSVTADVEIAGLYHYRTKIKAPVERGKVIPFGEIIVRSVPEKFCGNVRINIITEDNSKLINGSVTLAPAGFSNGKTEPVKDNTCFFQSIANGNFSAELARNEFFESANYDGNVTLGQTTEFSMNVFKRRVIDIDWRLRTSTEPNEWRTGKFQIKTKSTLQPGEIPELQYMPLVSVNNWTPAGCTIRGCNGALQKIDSEKAAENIEFNERINFGCSSFPVKENDVFVWQGFSHQSRNGREHLQLIMKVTKISPIEIPQ